MLKEAFVANKSLTDKETTHSYGEAYEIIFTPYKDAKLVVEIGIDRGGSLLAWRDFFPEAEVHGIDLRPEACKITDEERVHLHWENAVPAQTPLYLFEPESIDVLIDDGSHWLNHVITQMVVWWPYLRSGGVYVVEDVQDPKIVELLDTLVENAWGAKGIRHDLRPIKERYDDYLYEVRKP